MENHIQGVKDIYRSKEVRKIDTREKGGKASKDTWFRQGKKPGNRTKTTSVMKVPFTSGVLSSELSKSMKETTPIEGISTRIHESGGKRMKEQMIKPDPFSVERCSRSDCRTISRRKNGCGETCFQGNVNYTITCDECERQREEDPSCTLYMYIGESARGCYERLRGHMDCYSQKKGFMWKHAEEVHGGSKDLSFSIVREAVDPDPMRRIIRESVRINQNEWRSDVKLMNTKDEFFGVKTVRATFSQL